jgi:hypothetical protein
VNLRGDRRAAEKIWRGTDGSNPSPSSGESVANSNLSAEHANVFAACDYRSSSSDMFDADDGS